MKCLVYKILGITILCIGLSYACDDDDLNKNSFIWQGWWHSTDDPTNYGTFTADISIEGQNQDVYGGNGSLQGTIKWFDTDGNTLVDEDISGKWSNDYKNNHILSFDFDITISEESFTFAGYYGSSADKIEGDEFVIGYYNYGSEAGQWRTSPVENTAKDPTILEAFLLDTELSLLDLCWADPFLYATGVSGSDYKVLKINVQDGTYDTVTTNCPGPRGIAYNGSFFWLLSIEPEASRVYKYNTSWILDQDYPIDLVNHGIFGSIPEDIAWQDNGLVSFISSNSLIDDGIKRIDPVTGESTILFSSGISRAHGLATIADGFWTCFFAAGGDWCRLEHITHSGQYDTSFYIPVNEVGPIASQEGDIWLGLNSNRVIYKIGISE